MELNETLSLIHERIRKLAKYHLKPEPSSIKLNQNENPCDWPQLIKEEIGEFCKARPWNRYPNFIPERLKQRLSDYTGVPAEGILVGNGSNEMLLVLLLSMVKEGTNVCICQPTFTVYRLLVNGLGGNEVSILPEPDLSFSTDGIINTVKEYPGSVLIACSPNNPTGVTLSEAQIRAILEVHTGFFILDQAYVEFGAYDAIPLLKEYPNLIITRTFSKAMGGAGLRLGYMLGNPAVITEFNKIKLPYNINFFSEHVAEVLLGHADIISAKVQELVDGRDDLYTFFKTMPFENVYPSGANFMIVRTQRKDALFAHLITSGILVRDVSSYILLENCLRINVGTSQENEALKQAVKTFFAQ